MVGILRQLKGSPRSADERAQRVERINEVIALVSSYEPNFDAKKLKQALNWSERYFRECKVKRKVFRFPDPLRVVEYLASRRANATTITAAPIFAVVSPTPDKDFSQVELTGVGKTFGSEVMYIVRHAMQLDALKLLPLAKEATQTVDDQLFQFRRAMLRVAEIGDPIELRGAYRVVNLMEMHEAAQEHTFSRQDIDREARDIRDAIAPVAYRAGYEYLRYDLLDWIFRVESPERYMRVQSEISGDITSDEMAEAQKILLNLAKAAATNLGINPDFVSVEIREKSVPSTDAKATTKQKEIRQLGDLFGFQIIINEAAAVQSGMMFKDLDRKNQSQVLHILGNHCHSLYDFISKEIGRSSTDPLLRDIFKQLAAIDPHPTIAGYDARYDDYISQPKDVGVKPGVPQEIDLGFGYSGIHDSYVVRLNSGKIIVFEGKIFCSVRGENNRNHPMAGHVVYKTGMERDSFIHAWETNAAAICSGKPPKPTSVFVYDEYNQIFELPPGATVETFAESRLGKGNVPADLEAWVDNDDPLARRYPGTPSAKRLPLVNGDRIILHARSPGLA